MRLSIVSDRLSPVLIALTVCHCPSLSELLDVLMKGDPPRLIETIS